MKKTLTILLFVFLAGGFLRAQTADVLTNATIVKMVKAKLSDDIIIDEINNAKVNFDISADALKSLTQQNVSDPVIQAMKIAVAAQESVTREKPTTSEVTAAAGAVVTAAVATTAAANLAPVTSATAAPVIAASATTTQAVMPDEPQKRVINDTLKPLSAADTTTNRNENPALLTTGVAMAGVAATSQPNTEQVVQEPQVQPQSATALAIEAMNPAKEKEEVLPEVAANDKLVIEETKTETGTLVSIQKPSFSITAVSYVNPTKDLITMYNSEFTKLSVEIRDWDKKLQASLVREKQSLESIAAIEKELTDKKNANSQLFSKEITDTKTKLLSSWEKHKSIKAEMAAEGKALVEDLKKINKDTDASIAAKFKEVSKNVSSNDPDPSIGEKPKPTPVPDQKFSYKVTSFFTPVTMMLVCYQNEIIALQKTISAWNQKALNSFSQDSVLKNQLTPLQNELSEYMATSKQNQKVKKKEISALKKQIDNIEKERKNLAKQMDADSKKLSDDLNKMSGEVQAIVDQRFADIIESISHSYQDKFNQ